MARKLPDLLLVVAFIVIISLPAISLVPAQSFSWSQGCDAGSDSFTKCVLKALVDFPSNYTDYFNNHYFLYQQEVSALHAVRFFLLHEKTFPNVLIGKEDWLYYTGENNLNDYECASFFTRKELQAIRTRLLDWDAELQERGIRFYVVIAPNKETIYPQYLPEGIKPGQNSCRIDQIMQILQSTQLSVLDLREAMQTAAQTNQVYRRTDTHWNPLGAMVASREILARMKQDFPDVTIPSLDDYDQELRSFSGDLASFLPKDERFVEEEINLIPLFQPSALYEDGPERTVISHIPKSGLPAAIFFCDSFSEELRPFLSEHLSRIDYRRSFSLDLDLIDQEKPDIVVFEVAQRYLTVLR